MAHKIFLFNLFILPLFFATCNSLEPPPPEKTITLTLEDVSCIEAWIKLKTTNLQMPTTVTLKQSATGGDQTLKTINLEKADTLLYIDSLLPSQTYTFQTSIQPSSHTSEVKSNVLSVTTLDTTSHNFSWQSWTFGEHSTSVLNDVVIISENNIWAVGEIYLNDSLGQPDPHPYAIAHWDGQTWEYKKLFYNINLIVAPIRGILVLNPNDIYLAAGSVFHWDGNSSSAQLVYSRLSLPDPNATIEKLWGNSNSSVYGVGNVGSIVFYNDTNWQSIESGTDLHLYDIYGDYSEIDGTYEILVTAANRSVSSEKQILKISNTTTVTPLVTEGIPYSIIGIWFKANRKYYICGAGLFSKNNIETTEAWEELTVSNVYLESIDGNDLNDLVICGSFGELLHYNGVSWRSYSEMPGGSLLLSTKIKDNLVVTVGIENHRAFIAIGMR
jgi:hypothetical protein